MSALVIGVDDDLAVSFTLHRLHVSFRLDWWQLLVLSSVFCFVLAWGIGRQWPSATQLTVEPLPSLARVDKDNACPVTTAPHLSPVATEEVSAAATPAAVPTGPTFSVWFTDGGDKYHTDPDCFGLRRRDRRKPLRRRSPCDLWRRNFAARSG